MRTLEQVRTFVADGVKHPPKVMPFLSMVDRRKRMHLNICLRCLTDPDSFNTTIPSAAVIEKMGLTRAPVAATSPSQPAATAFAMLWHELNERLGL
jgi:hypothetical protein